MRLRAALRGLGFHLFNCGADLLGVTDKRGEEDHEITTVGAPIGGRGNWDTTCPSDDDHRADDDTWYARSEHRFHSLFATPKRSLHPRVLSREVPGGLALGGL